MLLNAAIFAHELSLVKKEEEWGNQFRTSKKCQWHLGCIYIYTYASQIFITLLYMLAGENMYCQNIVTFEWRKMIFAAMV